MTREQHIQTIIAALTEEPKSTPQLVTATGVKGAVLGNIIKTLLKRGDISRQRISDERYRYFIGQTAPGWEGYEPEQPKPEKRPMQYRIPVKRVTVRPFSIAGDAGMSAEVTLPAAPWECAA